MSDRSRTRDAGGTAKIAGLNAAGFVCFCEVRIMKTYLIPFAILATIVIFISGCATEPASTTTTTHTESTAVH